MTSAVDGGPVRARAGWAWRAVAGFLLLLATLAGAPAQAQTGICGRTEVVRDALVALIPGVGDCANVTDTHLAAITGTTGLSNQNITALAAGDFDGLTGLTTLNLSDNALTALPAGVFDELTSLTELFLGDNALTSLPAGVFDDPGTWSVAVPAAATYIAGTSVAVKVNATKTGYTAPGEVARTLAVDLTAPTAPSYTAPSSLKVGVAITAMTPSGGNGIDGYSATGLPSGLSVNAGTGAIGGTPDTADASTATATITASDTAGNTDTVDITFPVVAVGDQTLAGFAYSSSTVTYGDAAPTVTAPSGVETTLSYSATPSDVCTVDSSTSTNAAGDFFSPNPMTSFPDSLSLITSGVKSLLLDTMQNPATPRSCNRSIAVIVSSMSAEFFPVLT